jgi:hypothetical protein
MALFLFRFSPVLLPLFTYWIWLYIVRRRARKKGETLPRFRDGPIFWILMSTLLIGFLCIIALGFSVADSGYKEDYQTPRMENKSPAPVQIKP